MEKDNQFIRQDIDYEKLKAYQKAECVYDITYYFAHKYLEKGDRTIDQMIQAARSGKQNIIEGPVDGITSREMEIKLLNVARDPRYPISPKLSRYISSRSPRRKSMASGYPFSR